MKRILKRTVLSALAALLLLASCAGGGNGAGTGTAERTTERHTETDAPTGGFALLRDGKAIPVVYSELSYATEAERLAKAIGTAAGTEEVNTERRTAGKATDSTRAEILLGRVDCDESRRAYDELNDYSVCTVRVIGNKLVISSLEKASVTEAVTKLRLAISRMEDRNLTLAADFSERYYSSSTLAKAQLPIAEGQKLEIIEESNDSLQILFSDTSEAAFEAYCEKLAAAGYTLRQENTQEGNRHRTYINGTCSVQVSRFAGIGRLCLFVDPYKKEGQLPALEDSYTAIYDVPLLTQLGLYSNDPEIVNSLCENAIGGSLSADDMKKLSRDSGGMGYVIRLRDGRFLLIDGGYGVADDGSSDRLGIYMESEEYRNDPTKRGFEDADRIYNTMKAQTAEGQEPRVAAWIFTHADIDHVGAFIKFAEKYGKTVIVGQLIYNFPVSSILTGWGDQRTAVVQAAAKYYGSVPTVTAHAGQVYRIADLTVRMLFNMELLEPDLPKNLKFNDTSLVFQIETEDGTRLMILGDCYPCEAEVIDKLYSGETLKSDIVQVSHHGIEGVGHGDSLYKNIGATAALWPAGTWKYNYPCTLVNRNTDPAACRTRDERDAKHNKWIMDNIGMNGIYLAGGENTVFELRDHGLTPKS